jgi:hypothetical protein
MIKSNEIMKKILDFYEKKENIYKMHLEFIDHAEEKRIMLVSYYRDLHTRPINRLDITIIWSEKDGEIIQSDENCIAMRNRLNQFGMFEADELKFFDQLEMIICPEASNETGQDITDWWNSKYGSTK